jgi:transcription elongation factor GreA
MATFPITKHGAEALRRELQRLKGIERPSVINAIAEARAQGDLSENAEYDAAKDKQGFIEGRIMEIESKLSSAQVIDPSLIDIDDIDGRIVFGATVKMCDLAEDGGEGAVVTYQIVGDDEASLESGKISINSPVARALIGKCQGDVATVRAPAGVREYKVLAVEYRAE